LANIQVDFQVGDLRAARLAEQASIAAKRAGIKIIDRKWSLSNIIEISLLFLWQNGLEF
jgi:hypothetical protein